jgi:hypothetical protein
MPYHTAGGGAESHGEHVIGWAQGIGPSLVTHKRQVLPACMSVLPISVPKAYSSVAPSCACAVMVFCLASSAVTTGHGAAWFPTGHAVHRCHANAERQKASPGRLHAGAPKKTLGTHVG